MEPARLRTSNGGLCITSLTVVGHESVIQKYVSPFSGFPECNKKERLHKEIRSCTLRVTTKLAPKLLILFSVRLYTRKKVNFKRKSNQYNARGRRSKE